jgi:hypothetical protein
MQITFIFWLPLALSVIGSGFFVFLTDEKWTLKSLMAGLTVAGLVLQFGLMFRVHFLIPLALQLIVCIWVMVYWKLTR